MGEKTRAEAPLLSPEIVREIYDEMVGYGQPPRASRFQKGRSGNPKGRPRKKQVEQSGSTTSSAIAVQAAVIARRPIQAREGGKVREIDTVEGTLLQLQRKALAGDVPAARLLLEYVGQAERAEQERRNAEAAVVAAERAKTCAYWKDRVRKSAQQLADAKGRGLPTPIVYPHTDDVRFLDGDIVEIIGPIDAATGQYFDDLAARQEYWLASLSYDRWLRKRWKAAHPSCRTNDWVLVSELLLWADRVSLPERMQIPEGEMFSSLVTDARMSGRALFSRLSMLGRRHKRPVPSRLLRMPASIPPEAVKLCIEGKVPVHRLMAELSRCLEMSLPAQ